MHRSMLFPPTRWLFALSGASALAHLLLADRYGIFRDELYYIACGRHPAWGYVDHPPLIAVIARLSEIIPGDGLLSLRILSILTGSVVILLTGLLARELGGGRVSQILSALCVAVAPIFLFLLHILSMNVYDALFWVLAALILTRILQGGDERLWIAFGAVTGLGLLNKVSFLFFAAGAVLGLVATGHRRLLRSPWPWLACLLAAILVLPHLIWQLVNGWPTLEFMQRAQMYKNIRLEPLEFLGEASFLLNPVTVVVWLPGLFWLLGSRIWRPLGYAFLVVLVVLLSGTAKPYYLAPAAPLLLAAGGVAWERWSKRPRLGWLPSVLTGIVAVLGLALTPTGLPVLSEEALDRYLRALGAEISSGERGESGSLPQHFSDMHGWEDLARQISDVYVALPPEDRRVCGVLGANYGQAGAVDYFRDRYELPPAISGHNNYYLWGPRGLTGSCLIVLDWREEDLNILFEEVRSGGVFHCRWCRRSSGGIEIWVCRGMRIPMGEVWPQLRHYD